MWSMGTEFFDNHPIDEKSSLQNLQDARKCGIINIMAIVMLKPL